MYNTSRKNTFGSSTSLYSQLLPISPKLQTKLSHGCATDSLLLLCVRHSTLGPLLEKTNHSRKIANKNLEQRTQNPQS